MRTVLFLLILALALTAFGQGIQTPTQISGPGFVYVRGYYTRTGSYVKGHYRRIPLHKPVKHMIPERKDSFQKFRQKSRRNMYKTPKLPGLKPLKPLKPHTLRKPYMRKSPWHLT